MSLREAALLEEWRAVRAHLDRHGAREVAGDLLDAFSRNRVLTYSSAISFQAVFALIPLLLASVAVLSFLDLEQVWTDTVAPAVRDASSDEAFRLLDRTVESVLGSRQTFWLTLGAALALWELSGAVRAAMGALNDIYGAEEERSFVRRLAVSGVLAAALALLLGVAATGLQVVPRVAEAAGLGVLGPLAVAAAWALALVLMAAAVGLLLRFGPRVPQPARWLGFGTVAVVLGWAVASVGFAAYATQLASYGSIYSSLGIVILLLTYVYLSAVVFLGAAQVDALVRGYARSDGAA